MLWHGIPLAGLIFTPSFNAETGAFKLHLSGFKQFFIWEKCGRSVVELIFEWKFVLTQRRMLYEVRNHFTRLGRRVEIINQSLRDIHRFNG